ncbi:MAG: FMN-binding glutamate synthase family protein [Pseudomonadales bacterium]|nr:FMN-binding glutamate synthase family protein [Pseudomonadales bacterium]
MSSTILLPRYYFFIACVVIFVVSAGMALLNGSSIPWWLIAMVSGTLSLIGTIDLTQKKQAVRRNYPILAHIRFLLESIRPEIRQYFLETDTEEIPYSRQQRTIIYERAKNELNKRPFGTQSDVYRNDYEWFNHSVAPQPIASHDFRMTIGSPQCRTPYAASVFNISAMSYGALSPNAILALNEGARRGGFYHDTGEGSISAYHRQHGGDLVWEIGSGYFGCRHPDGSFNEEMFAANAASAQVKMIELKLSQGAKPGHGGVLPGSKVNAAIAAARGVAVGEDCVSPAFHSSFTSPIGLLEFVARLRELSGGKPTGFKLAIGHPWEWFGIAKAMLETGITPDFIVVDGAEGGTGAAPLEFCDHVGAPLREGLMLVHNTLVGIGLRGHVHIGAAGKIVTAFDIARTIALGADWCNAARGFMFALGCIQSQTCHTGRCPTGVSSQDPDRYRALVPEDKATRVYNFHQNTLHALKELLSAAGLTHPEQIGPEHIIRRISSTKVRSLAALHHWVRPDELRDGLVPGHPVFRMFWPMARTDSFAAPPSVLATRTTKLR